MPDDSDNIVPFDDLETRRRLKKIKDMLIDAAGELNFLADHRESAAFEAIAQAVEALGFNFENEMNTRHKPE